MSDEAIESPPVVPAMTADAGPLERGTCKADLTALEQAFRAGYAASVRSSGRVWTYSADDAWNEFLAVEMRALG